MAQSNPPERDIRQTAPRETARDAGATSAGPRAEPASFAPPQLPERIGQFEIKLLLGEGACGRVYLGFDPALGRQVAIKVPRREGFTPDFRERFLREARAAAEIHHPNICPVYVVGTEGELPFIVMRHVSGGTLAGLLDPDRSAMSLRDKLIIAKKLAKGLAAAHAKGVIHRDLKPSNVLYDKEKGEILITDFGLARIGPHATATVDGSVFGTPAYMSPEQARGQAGVIGTRSDIYSLGVILYEMLTGRVPFTGSVFEILRHHCETNPHPPSVVRPSLDPRLDALCLKAMAKQPGDRYPTAQAFADAVSECLHALRQPPARRVEPPGGTGEQEVLELPDEPFEDEDEPRKTRRPIRPDPVARRTRRGVQIVALLVLLLGLAVGGAILAKRQTDGGKDRLPTEPRPLVLNNFDQEAERKAADALFDLKRDLDSKSGTTVLKPDIRLTVFDIDKDVKTAVTRREELPKSFRIKEIDVSQIDGNFDGQLQKCFTGLSGPLVLHFSGVSFLSDDTLAVIARVPKLDELWLDDTPGVTDAGLGAFARHPGLKKLRLVNLRVSGAIGGTLGTLPALTHLDLDKPLATDELLAGLKTAPSLTNLNCAAGDPGRASRLTLAGMKSLAALPKLTDLNLSNHPIQDDWLNELHSLKLTKLALRNTPTTSRGRTKLQEAIKDCTVDW